jgi:hypothetical protein
VSEAPAAGLVVFTWLDRSSSTSQPQLPTPRAALCQLSCEVHFHGYSIMKTDAATAAAWPKTAIQATLAQKPTVPAGAFSRPAQSPGEGKVPFVLPRLPDARACD